ncbi:MAG: glycosyltransferase [Patescibacteria group bacterium]|nr:glycosyltransferase [Patescibacteria group bacterium]
MPVSKPKIALVHDFLTYFGGAERVLMSLHKLYPKAPIYTLLYDEKEMKRYFPKAKIRTSFLEKFPKFIKRRKKYLLPFLPTAAETFDLREFDLVISSSSSFTKGIITKPKTTHICYCHTPTRFLWDWHYNYLQENKVGKVKKIFLMPLLHYLRMWDKTASERVDYFIANSKNTAKRIKKFYNKESKVIYPPVNMHWFHNPNGTKRSEAVEPVAQKSSTELSPLWNQRNNYFLIISRLTSYKKIDIAIEAFNKLELPLIIIGVGGDRKRLEKMAEKNIKFLGFQPEEKIAEYYQNCQAFIFPGEDDFGIAPVEAMSFGKPVLAYRKGGALETIIEGETGEFFDDPIPEILADGIRRIKNNYDSYDPEKIKEQAKKFSEEKFGREMKKFMEEKTSSF